MIIFIAVGVLFIGYKVYTMVRTYPVDNIAKSRQAIAEQEAAITEWEDNAVKYADDNSYNCTAPEFEVKGRKFKVDYMGATDIRYDIFRTGNSTYWVGFSHDVEMGVETVGGLYIGGKQPEGTTELAKGVYFTDGAKVSVEILQ
ncbi:MAG: hypothetical protein RSC43_00265 [Clostridia bacterium]